MIGSQFCNTQNLHNYSSLAFSCLKTENIDIESYLVEHNLDAVMNHVAQGFLFI